MEIKNRQKLLLIVAGVAVALLVSDSLILTPLSHAWTARSKRIAELKQQLADGKMLMSREDAIRDRWENMRTNALPDNISLAESEVLKAVNRWAQESGISLASIKPQWKDSGEDYMTLECRADATGDIRTVSRFLYNLEKDPLGVKVESIEITSRDNDGRQLSLGLQLSALLLNNQEQ